MRLKTLASLTLAILLPAVGHAEARAPQPLKPVDVQRLYQGTWLEIARRPMLITNGCVAGTTTYARQADGHVDVTDACVRGAGDGHKAELHGFGTFEDPGTGAKLHVKYNPFIQWDYWILDHADDYAWFISANPDFDKLWIFTRVPPSAPELKALLARARSLGYDTSKLEFPPTKP